jgi:hypothetical protein
MIWFSAMAFMHNRVEFNERVPATIKQAILLACASCGIGFMVETYGAFMIESEAVYMWWVVSGTTWAFSIAITGQSNTPLLFCFFSLFCFVCLIFLHSLQAL